MIELDWSRSPSVVPRKLQKDGARRVIDNGHPTIKGVLALFDEVGIGKSWQVVTPACFLAEAGELDLVCVVTIANARSVFADPDPVLGEVAKHGFVECDVHEVSARRPAPDRLSPRLTWLVTNYEWLRDPAHVKTLARLAKGRKSMLVCDEAWMIKNIRSQQAKGVKALRPSFGRCVMLNATPEPNTLEDLYAPYQIMDPRILECKNPFAFRARYCVMGGFKQKEVVGYKNLDDFYRRTAPFTLRRTLADLEKEGLTVTTPERLVVEATLTPETWRHYTAMRDALVAEIDSGAVSVAAHAAAKAVRLAQITSGFLGGVEDDPEEGWQPDLYNEGATFGDAVLAASEKRVVEIGREKLDALLEWLETHYWPNHTPAAAGRPDPKLLVWSRFTPELERTVKALAEGRPWLATATLQGGQGERARDRAKRLLAPGGEPGPAAVVGNPAAGGAGTNYGAAPMAIYLSNSFNMKDREQSEGRNGPARRLGLPVTFVDVLARGPKGQKTVDHAVFARLAKKQDVQATTTAEWRRLLTEE